MEIWSFFDWWGSTIPTRPVWKTLQPKNFLSQSGCLILLRKSSPERLYHLNLFFCLAVPDYYWNVQNKVWLLMAFAVLCKCVFLNVKLIFLYIFKYVLTSCLYQFTFYIIYYICIINNNKYSNNSNSNNNIYMYIYIYILYIYIHFSLCTIFNIPFSSFKYQIQKKKKSANCPLSFFSYILKCKISWQT